jgi:hypothetical protein
MRVTGKRWFMSVVMVLGLAAGAAQAVPLNTVHVDFAGEAASAEALTMARWIAQSGDARGKPFAIVDKKNAKVFVFGADARLVGAAPVLLGLTPGDHAIPGIGQRALADILPSERTTPAGRFVSEPGRNLSGEAVVWVDYDAGFAIHRLRPGATEAARQQRLLSGITGEHRVSMGCIVVAPAFYDGVVGPTLGRARGVVYVLPETRSLTEVFSASLNGE